MAINQLQEAAMPLPDSAAATLHTGVVAGTEAAKTEAALREKLKTSTGLPAESLSAQLAKKETPTDVSVTEAANKNIGFVDSKGVRQFEAVRETAIKNAGQAALEILDGTFDLKNAKFNEIQADLSEIFNNILDIRMEDSSAPGGSRPLNATELRNAFTELLKDKPTLEAIRAKLTEALAQESSSQEVADAEKEFNDADKAHSDKVAEKAKVDADLPAKQTRLAEFAPGATADLRITTLKAAGLDATLATTIDTRDILKSTLAKRGALKVPIPPTVTELASLANLNNEIVRIQTDISERDSLIAEKAKLEQEIPELTARQGALVGEIATAQTAKDVAKNKFDAAKYKKGLEEAVYVDRIKHAVRDGVVAQMERRQEALASQRNAESQKKEAEATDQKEKEYQRRRTSRYFKKGKDGRPEFDKSKASQAALDVKELLSLDKDGARALLEAELKAAGYADAEVQAKLKDPDFVLKETSDIAERSIAAYLRVGKKLSPAEAAFIGEQAWGQGIIKKALDRNTAGIKDLDQEAIAKGYKGGITEFLSKHKKGLAAAAIIALILALVSGLAPSGMITGTVGTAIANAAKL